MLPCMVPPPSSAELADWIDRARTGDREARDALCRVYEPHLDLYVERHMGPALRRWVEPADIVQRVLFEVMQGLASAPSGLDEDGLSARLFRTANTRILDAARRHRERRGESVMPEDAGEPLPRLPSAGSVTRADTGRWLAELVARLPPKYAEPVRLIGLEELCFDEAGATLGLAPDTVRKRYGRARSALRERLASRSHDG